MRLDFCVACGSKDCLEQHHLIPKVMGGSDADTNLITFCAICHDIAHKHKRSTDRVKLQRIGIEKAKLRGVYRGKKPTANNTTASSALLMLNDGIKVAEVSSKLGLSRQTVYRIRDNPSVYLTQ